ncbi:MAG: aminoglycoside phosphotransferase family protein, partial [Caldilineaceae bacterium]|nr:aminoglycoside phosphotransferase family protein [Caldilineaceae bacterium]
HWEGRDNLLWRVDANGNDAVLKLFLDAGQARSRRQFAGHQLAAPLGLAPSPRWVDRHPEGLARQVLVYQWQTGDPLDLHNPTHGDALAQTLAQLHSHDPSSVDRFSPNPFNLDYLWRMMQKSIAQTRRWLHDRGHTLPSFDLLADQGAALIQAALPQWAGAAPAPIHGDPRPENVLVGFGQAILVDWEFFGLGDPAQEAAAVLHTIGTAWSAAHQESWLAAYLESMEQPGLAARIGLYRRVLPLRDLCFLLDGLRELAADPTDLAAHAEDLPFLAATTQATLTTALAALNLDHTHSAAETSALFAGLDPDT